MALCDLSFDELINHSKIQRILRREANKYPQAERDDMVQEALIELWQSLPGKQFEDDDHLLGWITLVVRNTMRGYRTQDREIPLSSIAADDDSRTYEEILDSLVNQTSSDPDASIDLYDIISCLSPRQQYLIRMRYYEDRTLEDIAQELGITKQAVHKAITAALRKLRETM